MTRHSQHTMLTSPTLPICVIAAMLVTYPASSLMAQEKGPLVRIKDITTIRGEHPNTISGFGLVTGLAGTGGSTPTTKQFASLLLQKMGNRADPTLRENIQRSQEKTNNMSVVRVNIVLPPHAKTGQKLDVIVSAFDDAKSLHGGMLEKTVHRLRACFAERR